MRIQELMAEALSKAASAGDWIHDFEKSKNPKFEGKSKEKRKEMALAAYYAKQRNESVVDKILEEAAITDKLKEIANHVSDHLGRHVSVSEIKKHYVQSARKKHEEDVKSIHESEVLFEEILSEAATVARDIHHIVGVVSDAYPHHSVEDLHHNLTNPDFKLSKPKGMSIKNHIHYSAAYENAQHAHLHNKIDDFQAAHKNSTNVQHIQKAVHVAKSHIDDAHDHLNNIKSEHDGVKAAKTGNISHISSGVPNRMHA